MKTVLYYIGLTQLLILQVILFRTKKYYENQEDLGYRIPDRAIIISNHRTFMDGIVIALAFFFRRIHFVAADFYGDNRRWLKGIIRLAGGIFVGGRESWSQLVVESRDALSKRSPILMFPEGEYQHSREPARFHTGYLRLAIELGAHIVPVANDFNYGLGRRVHLMIGNSIDLSEYLGRDLSIDDYRRINELIRNQFIDLLHKLKNQKNDDKVAGGRKRRLGDKPRNRTLDK